MRKLDDELCSYERCACPKLCGGKGCEPKVCTELSWWRRGLIMRNIPSYSGGLSTTDKVATGDGKLAMNAIPGLFCMFPTLNYPAERLRWMQITFKRENDVINIDGDYYDIKKGSVLEVRPYKRKVK